MIERRKLACAYFYEIQINPFAYFDLLMTYYEFLKILWKNKSSQEISQTNLWLKSVYILFLTLNRPIIYYINRYLLN